MTVEAIITSIIATLIADKLHMLIALGDLPDSSFGVQAIGETAFVLAASPRYFKAPLEMSLS
jgi:DNA-binding transcriptional LysR family regulator